MLYQTIYNDSLLEDDVLNSFKYFESLRKKTLTPDEKLMLALLENGIECFQKYIDGRRPRERRRFSDAEQWIMSRNDPDWCFSFDNACEMLRLDPDYVRKGVRNWQAAYLRSRMWSLPGKRPQKAVPSPRRRAAYANARMVGT